MKGYWETFIILLLLISGCSNPEPRPDTSLGGELVLVAPVSHPDQLTEDQRSIFSSYISGSELHLGLSWQSGTEMPMEFILGQDSGNSSNARRPQDKNLVVTDSDVTRDEEGNYTVIKPVSLKEGIASILIARELTLGSGYSSGWSITAQLGSVIAPRWVDGEIVNTVPVIWEYGSGSSPDTSQFQTEIIVEMAMEVR
ncbi:hypothetical protein KDL30_16190 [bacterium]|nr:hypothetical protein [bacterium]